MLHCLYSSLFLNLVIYFNNSSVTVKCKTEEGETFYLEVTDELLKHITKFKNKDDKKEKTNLKTSSY